MLRSKNDNHPIRIGVMTGEIEKWQDIRSVVGRIRSDYPPPTAFGAEASGNSSSFLRCIARRCP